MEKRAGELAVFRHEVNTEVWQKKQVLEKRKEEPTSECENLSKFISCFCACFLPRYISTMVSKRGWLQQPKILENYAFVYVPCGF